MLQTYRAILRGNYLEWSGETPEQLEREQSLEVHVTILKETAASRLKSQGRRMAEAVERLASINALAEISDSSKWQREQREERPLPGREMCNAD